MIQLLDDILDQNRKSLLANKRELNLIDSELNRFHRQQLIENQTTLSLVMDTINDFEKSFYRTAHEEK